MIHMILLAAGFSSRFQENKLLYPIEGKPMIYRIADTLTQLKQRKASIGQIVVVSQYPKIEEQLKNEYGFFVVHNPNSERGISSSLILGLQTVLGKEGANSQDSYLFCVADQPHLKWQTMKKFLEAYEKQKKHIFCMSIHGEAKNPVIFHAAYADELQTLTGDRGGKVIVHRHIEDTGLFEVEAERELDDLDYKPEIDSRDKQGTSGRGNDII